MPGFVEFHLLKGPEAEDHTLYSSHTVWQSKANFEAWTTSDEFRASHARASNTSSNAPLYIGHPQFEGFDDTRASKLYRLIEPHFDEPELLELQRTMGDVLGIDLTL